MEYRGGVGYKGGNEVVKGRRGRKAIWQKHVAHRTSFFVDMSRRDSEQANEEWSANTKTLHPAELNAD